MNGSALAVLTIATAQTEGPRRRRGAFVIPDGLTGEYARARQWINFRGPDGNLGHFMPRSEDFEDGFIHLRFYESRARSGEPTANLGDGPAATLSDVPNVAVPLEPGDRLAVLNAADNAAFEGEQ